MTKLWQTVQLGQHTFDVQARLGTTQTNGEAFVLLQDVDEVFPGVVRLQVGKRVLGFMVNDDGNRLQPLRVPYMPGETLEAVLASNNSTSQSPPPSAAYHSKAHERFAAEMALPPRHSDKPYRLIERNLYLPDQLRRLSSDSNIFNPKLGTVSPSSPQSPQLPLPPQWQPIERQPERRQDISLQFSSMWQLDKQPLQVKQGLVSQLQKQWGLEQELMLRRQLQQSMELPSSPTTLSPFRPHEHLSIYSAINAITAPIPVPSITDVPQSISDDDEEILSQYRQSVLLYQSYLEHIHAGQTEMADAIDQDFQLHFETLRPIMVNHLDVQDIMVDMKQSIQLLQEQKVERLTYIQQRIRAILSNNIEIHLQPTPRLFIILPNDIIQDKAPSTINQFRLYFLCECGDHTTQAGFHSSADDQISSSPGSPLTGIMKKFTMSTSSINSSCSGNGSASISTTLSNGGGRNSGSGWLPQHIHLAKHEGYELDRPIEFLENYGHYVLSLLEMLKYGVSIEDFTVPALVPSQASISDNAKGRRASIESNLGSAVEQAISFLQSWADLHSQSSTNNDGHHNNNFSGSERRLEAALYPKVRLDVNKLIQLKDYLKTENEKSILGNLYRVVTDEGYVRWICLDHYRDNFNSTAIKELQVLVAIEGGSFEERYGRIEISLTTPSDASQFYKALERVRSVQELAITLKWELSFTDAKALRDAITRSSAVIVQLNCTASNSAGEMLNRNKRAEPFWQIMSLPRLRSFSLCGYSGLYRRIMSDVPKNALRVLKLGEEVDWSKDKLRIVELLAMSPELTDLTLVSTKIYEAYHIIRQEALKRCPLLSKITVEASKDEKTVAYLEHGQVLVGMEVVIPSIGAHSRLFDNIVCITSIHISSRASYTADIKVFLELIRRNNALSEFKVWCYVSEFLSFYDSIRRAVMETKDMNQSPSLQKVCLYRGENQLFTTDIIDPEAVTLELLQLNVHKGALLQLIDRFGSKVTKLRINGPQWKAAHSAAFLESITRASLLIERVSARLPSLSDESSQAIGDAPLRPSLTHLYQAVGEVDESMLEDLAVVVKHSEQLKEYHITMDRPFKTDVHRSMHWIEFMKSVSDKITSLVIWQPNGDDWVNAFGAHRFEALENVTFEQSTHITQNDVFLKLMHTGMVNEETQSRNSFS
ncbi:hypothetical protein BCR41DRAFT_344348 [Lobosporangium transversale]|uniref:Uncharacterized protein n=1 Tax=Lobosporangium transversale TaxID=64571 RepID=A0A1Y2H4P4_9FUNG|nr:hypothetical protein BCR41DRAFT_344348 [Lobosporangium transversale]ORZ28961.1 hypothetical protein BCR41DRAFT_344348 [Lobosporangium transversale]|eukprot:XP_021886634.1 hypothetical protein BCR41DRAFT_344348 [Lobosporangium transversale]